ncbi:zinc finger CCCH domain-containing protein 4 isoform X1 [Rhipicephalus sanguineus]|uniref:zinc finger CCCH domain-containing protein 4 isoform X1 n=1 Tax=Rhipicephalus sanguineus TaxID=34632 RepID=UPI001895A9CC|nr:zinc finger CCCH domain-containing protein 4 isoform X1 [Rhipicephalus sanguineus]
MALESVFAKALPKVGHANKDTQNGEMESEGVDEDVPSADLEEGEIIDSGQEDSDDQRTGPPGPLLKGPPLPPQEALRPAFTKLEKRKRKKRKKDEPGGPEQKQKRAHYVDHDRMVDDTVWFSPESGGGPSRGHHSHHGGSMPPRDFSSPGPYDDSYMPMALLHDQLEFERLCASRGVLEEMLNGGLLMRIHPCDMSPRGGCDSPEGSGGPEGHQEGMGGPPPPHAGGFPSGRGGRGRGKSFMMDSRRPGPPKKKKKKKLAMSGGRGGGAGGKRGDGPPKRSICKFYLDSKCVKGADCPFSHDVPQPRKADLCKFYLGGYCARGEHCSFMHQDFPCKFFHTGAKCYADTACRFSHQPLTDETRRLLHRYLDNHGSRGDDDIPPGPGPNGPEPMDRPDCLDEDMGPGDDFGGGGPQPGKRPSLLGSPPRHVKEAAETWRMQFLGGGGPPMRGGPNAPPSFGPPQGAPMMSPPRGPGQGFPHRPLFYMDSLSQSPVRGSMPPPGASPPQMGRPSPVHCIEDSFGGPPGPMGPGGPMRPLPQGQMGGFASPTIASPPQQDQGGSGPGFAPAGGMSPLGIFYDSSQDHPMSPPHQHSPHHTAPQSIPGLNLLSSPSPPHSQGPEPTKIPSTDASSEEPHQSPQRPAHTDEQDTSDDSLHAVSEKKVLPPNLPRRQRELFMRIQQQQRAAEITAAAESPTSGGTSQAAATDNTESPVVAKPEPKNIVCLGNSESSDDDEDYDDDQPLRAVLKKLQQGPVENTVPANVPSTGPTSAPSTMQQPAVTLPSMAGIDIASMLNSIRQVPSQSQTNFWKQLFSGVPAATAAATSVADTTTPASFSSLPPASRDPRRARGDSQIAKPSTELSQLSRDPRLRDKPPPVVKAAEVAFVESKDGDVPFRLTPILRALPKYDDVAHSGSIPETKLKNDPRLAKYMSQKAPPVVPSAEVVQSLPLPAVTVLPQLPTVRRDPRMARHLEQQQPPQQQLVVENKPLIAEPPKVAPLPAEVVPKADPRKAAALAANGSAVSLRLDPRLAKRLDQLQKGSALIATETPASKPKDDSAMEVDREQQQETKPATKRDPRQRTRGTGRSKASADGAGRKNRMDYASPLSTYESEGDRPSGYSSYQRRPQPRPPVLPTDVPAPAVPLPPQPSMPPAPPMHDLMPNMPPPGVISDDLLFEADQAMKSLKDVFKTKDPTASPFC